MRFKKQITIFLLCICCFQFSFYKKAQAVVVVDDVLVGVGALAVATLVAGGVAYQNKDSLENFNNYVVDKFKKDINRKKLIATGVYELGKYKGKQALKWTSEGVEWIAKQINDYSLSKNVPVKTFENVGGNYPYFTGEFVCSPSYFFPAKNCKYILGTVSSANSIYISSECINSSNLATSTYKNDWTTKGTYYLAFHSCANAYGTLDLYLVLLDMSYKSCCSFGCVLDFETYKKGSISFKISTEEPITFCSSSIPLQWDNYYNKNKDKVEERGKSISVPMPHIEPSSNPDVLPYKNVGNIAKTIPDVISTDTISQPWSKEIEDVICAPVTGVHDLDVPTDIPTDIPTDVPTDIPTDVPTDVPSVPDLSIPDVKIDFSPFKLNLKDKFPFCIPYDLINLVRSFVSSKRTIPEFYVTFPGILGTKEATIKLSFKDFVHVAALLRYFILIAFICSLIKITRDIIRG